MKESAKSIAVLPFVNMSSSEENEYFSDGMTEEIINALAKIKELKITSRTSSFYFKNKQIPLPQIGKELGVSTILEGSIRLAGNKMRITAQLIDVEEDVHYWSETFDRSVEDIFAVQDEISLLIADKLRENLGHFEIGDHLVDVPEIPVSIYKKYLEGRYHLMKLSLSGTEKGISIFQEIITEQPDFPLPYVDINQGYAYLGTLGLIPAAEAFAKAKPYLDKAIELGEHLPEVQLNLAWISCWQNWDLENTYRHLHNALEIRPADNIYLTYANTLTVEGKYEAAHTYVDKAIALDPFSAMNHHFKGFIYYLQEQYKTAIPHFDKSLSLQPDLYYPQQYWGQALLMREQYEEAISRIQRLPEDEPGDVSKLGGLTLAYAAMGEGKKAETGIEQLQAALQSDAMGSALYFLILCQTILGRPEEAIALIERGIRLHLPNMLLLYTEPILKPLNTHTRFQALMKQALGERTSFGVPVKKYKKSLLSQKQIVHYKERLEELMYGEKPYLDPALSLRDLATRLLLPPNHLSQLLSEGFDKNFSEYVNTFRLEAFKSQVADPSRRHLTLLALAYESGFNSKTVFNTFFKKKMDMTPRAYWKEVEAGLR